MTNQTNPGPGIEAARQSYEQLLNEAHSLILATTNADGTPLVSYGKTSVIRRHK